ncbi:cytochrome b/b6 domain-containing protein [Camelimonas abortus]|uniref:Cytochrome b/b6 domain-containing protein n=1 Tax=Camelimonas abortus TaxID=1017184 RepID=A0ABV7LGK2_9HYPH
MTAAPQGPGVAGVAPARAWDGPTRLYHWTQLALVAGAFYTQWFMDPALDPTMRLHRWCGYGVLVLLAFRLLWGFAGAPTARFSHFLRPPGAVARYVARLLRGGAPAFLGHNPLGALMVAALLLLLAAQALSGLFTADSNGIFGGPFAHFDLLEEPPAWKARLQAWHHIGANVIFFFVLVHVLVNLYCQFVKREPLVSAMITGVKPAGDYADAADAPRGSYGARALACLAVAVAATFGGIWLAGGSP